jgi:hypothetical protein
LKIRITLVALGLQLALLLLGRFEQLQPSNVQFSHLQLSHALYLVPSLLTSPLLLSSERDFESMAKRLCETGVPAAAGATLVGKSGTKHDFAFAITQPTGKAKLVVDTALSVNGVDETKVLAFYVKVFDIGPERAILAVSPKLTDRARALAREYRIIVLENEAPRKLVPMVADTVEKALNEPWKL